MRMSYQHFMIVMRCRALTACTGHRQDHRHLIQQLEAGRGEGPKHESLAIVFWLYTLHSIDSECIVVRSTDGGRHGVDCFID